MRGTWPPELAIVSFFREYLLFSIHLAASDGPMRGQSVAGDRYEPYPKSLWAVQFLRTCVVWRDSANSSPISQALHFCKYGAIFRYPVCAVG
jgi:hypothetical protein